MAFHPNYKNNRYFFVYYSANDGGKRRRRLAVPGVERYQRIANPASEKRIWSRDDPFENHNGGTIAFGPDGYLYITLGDSGAAEIPRRPVRIRETGSARFYGSTSIIRRKEKPMGYRPTIPPARYRRFAHSAPEVYCIGLRNVWKFSFDRKTGELWAGDVGQNLWEMVHLIENGGNYGWSIREGFHPFQPQRQRPDAAAKISAADRRVSACPTRDRQEAA